MAAVVRFLVLAFGRGVWQESLAWIWDAVALPMLLTKYKVRVVIDHVDLKVTSCQVVQCQLVKEFRANFDSVGVVSHIQFI